MWAALVFHGASSPGSGSSFGISKPSRSRIRFRIYCAVVSDIGSYSMARRINSFTVMLSDSFLIM
jgi:hypothetical protein